MKQLTVSPEISHHPSPSGSSYHETSSGAFSSFVDIQCAQLFCGDSSEWSLFLGILDQDCKDVELVRYLLFAAEKVGQADYDSAEKLLIRWEFRGKTSPLFLPGQKSFAKQIPALCCLQKRGWRKKYEEDDLKEAFKSLGPCIAYPQKDSENCSAWGFCDEVRVMVTASLRSSKSPGDGCGVFYIKQRRLQIAGDGFLFLNERR
nr:DELLA protein RGL2-like [Ipomoea batatas]